MMKAIIYISCYLLSAYIAGCGSSSKNHVQEIISAQRAIKLPDSLATRQKKGTDFFASGDYPCNWQLEMDLDNYIRFTAADGANIFTRPYIRDQRISKGESYQAFKVGDSVAGIYIVQAPCTTNGTTYPKIVSVDFNARKYTGCGMYLFDHRLHDSWELIKINEVVQYRKDYAKALPDIKFDLQKNSCSGSTGCNIFSGELEIQGNRIRFEPMAFTKMGCVSNKAERILMELVSGKTVDFYEKDGQLVLYLGDDSKLVYTRKVL